MRKSTLLIGTALATVMTGAATSADAAGQGWYISGAVGANWVDDDSFRTVVSTTFPTTFITTVAGSVDYDTGWAIAGAAGYRFSGNWRLEGELSGRWNDFDSHVSGPTWLANVSGDVTATALMANLVWDPIVGDRIHLSLGAGVGFAWVDWDGHFSFSATTTTFTTSGNVSNDDSGFAYQLIGGIAFEATDNGELFLEYRYFATDGIDNVFGLDDYNSHTVFVGFRHDLNAQ